jgi:hypothetical protein
MVEQCVEPRQQVVQIVPKPDQEFRLNCFVGFVLTIPFIFSLQKIN